MTIPDRVAAARRRLHLTQRQVGEARDYGDNAQMIVARWEAGTRPIPRSKMRTVGKLLELPLSALLPDGNDDDESPAD